MKRKIPVRLLSMLIVLSLCGCSIQEGGSSVPSLSSEQETDNDSGSSESEQSEELPEELTDAQKQWQEMEMNSRELFATLGIENSENTLEIYIPKSYFETYESKLLNDALSDNSGSPIFVEKDKDGNVINPFVRMLHSEMIDSRQNEYIPMKYYYEGYKNKGTGEVYEYYLKFAKDEDIPKAYRYDLLSESEKAALGEVITPTFKSQTIIIESVDDNSDNNEDEFVPQVPPDYAVTDFDKLILSFDPYVAFDVSTLKKQGEQYIIDGVELYKTDKLNALPKNLNSADSPDSFDKAGRYWGDEFYNEAISDKITVKAGDKIGALTVINCYSIYNSGIKGFLTEPETVTYYNCGAEIEGYSISFDGEITLQGFTEVWGNGIYFYSFGQSLYNVFEAVPADYCNGQFYSIGFDDDKFVFAYNGKGIYITAEELEAVGCDINSFEEGTTKEIKLTFSNPELYCNKQNDKSFGGKLTSLKIVREID